MGAWVAFEIWELSFLGSCYISAFCLHRCEVYANKCVAVTMHEYLDVSVKIFCTDFWRGYGTLKRPPLIPEIIFYTFLTAVLTLGLGMALLSCLIRLSHVPTDHHYPSPPEELSTALLRYSLSSQPCWPLGQPLPNANQVGGWVGLGGGASSPDFRGKIARLTARCCWWTGALPGYESGQPQWRRLTFLCESSCLVWPGPGGPLPVTCVST